MNILKADRVGRRIWLQGGRFHGAELKVEALHGEYLDELQRRLNDQAELVAALRALVADINNRAYRLDNSTLDRMIRAQNLLDRVQP